MKFKRSDWMGDWFTLEGAADFGIPEGTAEEWLAICDAMERGESLRFKRVGAYKTVGDFYEISSPRNACGPTDHYPVHPMERLEFIKMVRNEVLKHAETVIDGGGI